MDPVQPGESSAMVAARVQAARDRQLTRSGKLNSQLSVKEINEYCRPDASGRRLLWKSREKLGMSVRSYHRTLRVARTIADLEGGDALSLAHVAEALQLKRAVD
jgi:magnesium chelatase family protein